MEVCPHFHGVKVRLEPNGQSAQQVTSNLAVAEAFREAADPLRQQDASPFRFAAFTKGAAIVVAPTALAEAAGADIFLHTIENMGAAAVLA
jgi:hypothetical protein